MTHGRTQEADMETTHKIPETYTRIPAIDKKMASIHARESDKNTIPESVSRNNRLDWFDSSHFSMKGDKIAKT